MDRRTRRGNYLVITALGLPVLFGFLSLSFETARLYTARQELSNATDAAAHFALVSFRKGRNAAEIQHELSEFYAENNVDGRALEEANLDIVPGMWNFDTSSWTPIPWSDLNNYPVNAFGAVGSRVGNADGIPLILNPFGGSQTIDLMTDNASVAAARSTDFLVVMDVTMSFREEMGMAKKGALTILNTLSEMPDAGNRIGMITFTGGAEVMTPLRDAYADYTDIYAAWSGQGLEAPQAPDTTCVPRIKNGEYITGHWTCDGPQFVRQTTYIDENGEEQTIKPAGTAADPMLVLPTQYTATRGLSVCNVRALESNFEGYDPHGYIFQRYNRSSHSYLANDVAPCGKGGGGTNPGSGLDLALDHLILNGSTASAWQLLLVTDGQPYYDNTFNHHTFPRWEMPSDASSHDGVENFTKQVAAEICGKGISLSTLFYAKAANSEQAAKFKTYAATLRDEVVCDDGVSQFKNSVKVEDLPQLMDEMIASGPITLVQ